MASEQKLTLHLTNRQFRAVSRLAHDAALPSQELILAKLGLLPGVCMVCGCTDASGCAEGCEWIDDKCNLCDLCAESLDGRWQWEGLGLIFPE
jgi:hypothetical protein